MKVGIVGNGSDKFTKFGEANARMVIRMALRDADIMVSGHSPVGGIDIWSEEEALALGIAIDPKTPEVNQWNPPGQYGYKERNLDIARDSDKLYVVLADEYPASYTGRRFKLCYHCQIQDHVKSGGCWTGKQAMKMDKPVHWVIVPNYRK